MSAVSPHSHCWHSHGKRPWKQAVSSSSCSLPLGEHGWEKQSIEKTRKHRACSDFNRMCSGPAHYTTRPKPGREQNPQMDIAAAVHGDITCILSAHQHVALLAGNMAYIQARYHTHILLPWDAGNVGTKALDGWPHSETASGAGVLAYTSAHPTERVASLLHTSAYSHCVPLLFVQLCSLAQKSTKINGNTSTSVIAEKFLRNVFQSFKNFFIQSLQLHNRMTDWNEQVWATIENIGQDCSWQNQKIKDNV